MFSFKTRLPVSEEQKRWVDDGFAQLYSILGRERMLRAAVVLPNDTFFPDPYDGSQDSVRAMATRIAGYMGIDKQLFLVTVYAENEEAWREQVPTGRSRTRDAAGLYLHEPEEGRRVIGVHARQLKDPIALAATLAHELAHVLLLGGNLLAHDAEDMEPMTDLCTVYLGLGVINAGAAFRFQQWQDNRLQGWSTSRLGYLSEELWGYALARFAHERGEAHPLWVRDLPTNIRTAFRAGSKWLEKNPPHPQA